MSPAEFAEYPQSKFGPPHRAHAPVLRPRLLAQLDGGTPLLLLIAPAGSGKTSLLASWRSAALAAEDAHQRHATRARSVFIWYNLDPADREPARFIDGLAAAIEQCVPGAGVRARAALAGGGAVFAALAILLAALEGLQAATLVLDDCHHLDGARGAETLLEHLVRNRPAGLRLVLSSRSIPLLPALSAVAAGELRALGRDDLQFSADEAAALLQSYDLEQVDISALVRATQGWAMGLLLLARTNATKITFMQHPSEALAEYLITQIVDRLSEDLRTFLLESSLLSPFTVRDAEAILERPDSETLLHALLRQGLFVDSHGDPKHAVIRYQDMFADALSVTLRRESPARYRAIHERAADHYGHDPPRALAHSTKLDDPEALAAQLDRSVPILRRQGHWETLVRYTEMLPESSRSLMLLRLLSYAYYARGEDGRAMAVADLIHTTALVAGDREAAYSALVLRANPLVRQDRYQEALALCLPAVAEARRAGLRRAEGWLNEICVQALLGQGRIEEGRLLADGVLAQYRAEMANEVAGATLTVARFCHILAFHLLELGDDEQAETLLDEAISLADDLGDGALAALCRATKAEALLLRGQDSAASLLAQEASDKARDGGNLMAWRTALRVRARACGHLGQLTEALAALDLYNLLTQDSHPSIKGLGLAFRAHLCLEAGDRSGARAATDQAVGLGLSRRALGAVKLEQGVLALAEGRDRDADWLLGEAAKTFEQYALRPQHVRALILRAEALFRLGKEARAVPCLAQAGHLAVGTGWLAGLEIDAEPALGALRALTTHWRLQGRGRELVEHLLLAASRRQIRLVPMGISAPRPVTLDLVRTMAPEEPWRFSPFGEGTLYRGGEGFSLARLRGEKARELLAYALWQGRPLSRDEILEGLWEGANDERTLGAMRTAGYQIRRFLGPSAWTREGGLYAVGYPVDDYYRSLLALAVSLEEPEGTPAEVAALASRALSLYTGDYLPWCYSDWTAGPRDMARTAALTAVTALVSARRGLGQPGAALEAAERGLAIEPYHEGLRHSQVSLLVELGRPGEALDCYRTYLQILADEGLGSPSTALHTLIASLRQGGR